MPDRDESDAASLRPHHLLAPGDRVFVWCEGGPAIARTVTFPPPAELTTTDGVHVLVDDDAPHAWRYEFVPASAGS